MNLLGGLTLVSLRYMVKNDLGAWNKKKEPQGDHEEQMTSNKTDRKKITFFVSFMSACYVLFITGCPFLDLSFF